MNSLNRIVLSMILVFAASMCFAGTTSAESFTSGVVHSLYISQDKKAQNGDIVSFDPKGYVLSKIPYDSNMTGVVVTLPAVSLVTKDVKDAYPVVRNGTALVRVSGVNGSIKKGDLVTSSTMPGVGMKSLKTGYVLGAALEDHKFAKPSDIALVPVLLDTHYYVGKGGAMPSSLKDIFNLSVIASLESPSAVLKYLMVVLIVIISFVSGFYIFQRTVLKGIDSIGRNPLAANIIQISMLVSILVTIGVVSGGLFIAYLVLRL